MKCLNVNRLAIVVIMLIFFAVDFTHAEVKDTLATVLIDNVTLIQPNELGFDIILKRNNNRWGYFANGTFQLEFDSLNYAIKKDNLEFTFTQESDLKLFVPVGDEMPKDAYFIQPVVVDSRRLSIMVAGPEEIINTKYIPEDSRGIKIGSFRLLNKDGSFIPTRLKWMTPANYYQALAYKLEEDSLLSNHIVKEYKNKNIEIYDTTTNFVNYEYRPGPNPVFTLDYFKVKYISNMITNVEWKTSSEAFNKGFILKRGFRFSPDVDCKDVVYDSLVSSYPPDEALKGVDKNGEGAIYSVNNQIPIRGPEYCYKLSYVRAYKNIDTVDLACGCVPVPNAVISFAQANPNPFSEYTDLDFTLDDDVYLTINVSDLTGKEIDKILDHKLMKRGRYPETTGIQLRFKPKASSTNGMYQIVFIAYPINDKTVDKSTAMLKVQYIK